MQPCAKKKVFEREFIVDGVEMYKWREKSVHDIWSGSWECCPEREAGNYLTVKMPHACEEVKPRLVGRFLLYTSRFAIVLAPLTTFSRA